ncbi:hypothetical protein BHE74_00049065, partial [Ensete ventricosum]
MPPHLNVLIQSRFVLSSGKAPYQAVHTSPPAEWRTARYRVVPPKSAISSRFRLLAIDCGRNKKKEKRRRRRGEKYLVRCSSTVPPHDSSPAGNSFSPRGEKDRGD